MEGSEPVLHHTVRVGEGAKSREKERGIVWPARHLAKDVGPRPPGSQGERSAARFMERELKAQGLRVETQEFRTPATTAWSEFLVHVILVVGVLLFPVASHLSYGLICIGFVLFLLEEFGRCPLSWLQPHGRSRNVLARIEPSRDAAKTVVLLAHMDSPRSAFFYHPSLVRLVRFSFLLDLACQAAIFMLFTVAYGGYLLSMEEGKLNALWVCGLILVVPPALALFALLSKAAAGKATPGGNDNASGCAVLLQLARVYSRRQPRNVELWLAATGAGDVYGLGARRLARGFRRELRDAYFIVLDGVGRGFPVCYRREGKLLTFRANRRLTGLVRHVSDVHPHYGAGFRRNSLYISEGFQLLSRGRKAVTISSREDSRYPRFWRWRKDDYDNLNPRSLRLSVDFVTALVDGIDQGGSGA